MMVGVASISGLVFTARCGRRALPVFRKDGLHERRSSVNGQAERDGGFQLVAVADGDEICLGFLVLLRRGHDLPEHLVAVAAVGVDRDVAPIVPDGKAGVDVGAGGEVPARKVSAAVQGGRGLDVAVDELRLDAVAQGYDLLVA